MFSVQSNFFGIFKIGDNVAYNLEALSQLYKAKTEAGENGYLFNKYIILNFASICEAILYDFNFRINKFTVEGVVGLSARAISLIRLKEYDEFEQLIACSKKYDFFKGSYVGIYDDLTVLRKARNRIHIQNKKGDSPADEYKLFTGELVLKAEFCAEAIIKTMNTQYPRPGPASTHVRDLTLPWVPRIS
jgi:hypothetical protein